MSNLIVVAVIAYLVGSISFAVVISAAMGLADPRTYGSGNPGVTNVLRTGNKLAAALTLIGDVVKGWLPVWGVARFGAPYGLYQGALALAALAVFIGHLYPVFFNFKGGKGVATAAGVLFGIHPLLGLATVAIWLIIACWSRYSSLAALTAALFAPFCYWIVNGVDWVIFALLLMMALLVYRHRDNIHRLLRGQESRMGQEK